MRSIINKVLITISLGVFVSSIGTFSLPDSSTALSSSSWQAGRIVDDAIFFNPNTYNANQVQAFLNAKVPVCNTNHAAGGGYNPPFICLKDYSTSFTTIAGDEYCPGGLVGGTKSAAQIIAETSVNCGINPQVILVTLQKEQSLVTDDWPWPIQYEKATGFSCPDTAACDPAYAGFAKQVFYGARQFQKYTKRPDLFPNYRAGRTSRVYYNPNSSCGYSDVYIQTQSTSNLYIYTPYQPNASALANLYGEGDSCGAYGNRNFWRLFNDWFGPTIGPLLRTTTSSNLYYTDGSKKYLVSSMQLAEQYGLTVNDVRYVTQSEINSIPSASYPLSAVVKSDSDSDEDGGALYLISKGKRIQFSSMAQFTDFGFQNSQVSYMPIGNLYRMPADQNFLSNYVQAPSLFMYKVAAGQKRGIFDLSTLNTINPSGKITTVSDFTLSSITLGQPYIVGDAVLKGPDNRLWLYQDGSWLYIPSLDVYNCWGFNSIKNFSFSNSQAVAGSGSTTLSCFARRSNGDKYLLNKVNRIPNDVAWGFTNFSAPMDRTTDRLASQPLSPNRVFRSSSNSNLYVFESGAKRQILNMTSFSNLGYRNTDIVTIQSGLMASIPTGVKKLSSGALIKDGAGKIYVVKDENKLYIPNTQTLNSFGYVASAITTESSQLLSHYSTTANLQSLFKIGSGSYLMDNATLWTVPSSLTVHYGVTGGTPSYNVYMLGGAQSQKTATRFIKDSGSTTIYYLDNGQKRPVSSWQKLVDLGGGSNTTLLSLWAINQFPTGPQI